MGCSGPARDASPPAAAAPPPLRLRVLTYNIHHAEGSDRRVDLERIAGVISEQQPDLVAVQEVDVKTRRSGGVDQAAELARLTGLHVAFGKAIDYQGGAYGQVVLSRFPIERSETHRLPGEAAAEQRIALAVTVRPRPAGAVIRFISTHLDHRRDETDRLRQGDELNRLFAEDEATPVILAGDFNSVPEFGVMRRLAARWWDAAAHARADSPAQVVGPRMATYPAADPARRIDYVLLRPTDGAWRVVEVRVIPETVASDHSPVLAVVEWVGR